MSIIQFEGRDLNKDHVGKVWREGNSIFCQYKDKQLLLQKYNYPDWTDYAFKYLLFKLGRITRWI